MKIRKALNSDLSKVLEINQACLPHVSSVEYRDMERFLDQASPFLVVEVSEKIAGFMIVLQKGLEYKSLNYQFFCNNYTDFDYVDRIAIAEEHRGKKLGTALYQYLFEHSEKKMVACEVNLNPPNPKSMEFHKALGFIQVAEQKTEAGKKSVAMMVKRL